MKELEDIVKSYHAACSQGIKTALATRGTRRGLCLPGNFGAKMLVTETGVLTRRYRRVAQGPSKEMCTSGKPMLMSGLLMLVTMRNDGHANGRRKLGCNGIIHILLEPVNAEDPTNPVACAEIISHRASTILVTLFTLRQRKAPQPGTCLVLTANGQMQHCITDGNLQNAIICRCTRITESFLFTKTYLSTGNDIRHIRLTFHQHHSLFIAGAGSDVVPLVHQLRTLGWHTIVVDDRPNAALPPCVFPEATLADHRQTCTGTFPGTNRSIYRGSADTHNYSYDLALLAANCFRCNYTFTGVLGPAKSAAHVRRTG